MTAQPVSRESLLSTRLRSTHDEPLGRLVSSFHEPDRKIGTLSPHEGRVGRELERGARQTTNLLLSQALSSLLRREEREKRADAFPVQGLNTRGSRSAKLRPGSFVRTMLCLCGLSLAMPLAAQTNSSADSPPVFLLDGKQLTATREKIRAGDPSLTPALQQLKKRCRCSAHCRTIFRHVQECHSAQRRQTRLPEPGALFLAEPQYVERPALPAPRRPAQSRDQQHVRSPQHR